MFLVSGNGLSAAAEEILRTVGRILTEYEEVCGSVWQMLQSKVYIKILSISLFLFKVQLFEQCLS